MNVLPFLTILFLICAIAKLACELGIEEIDRWCEEKHRAPLSLDSEYELDETARDCVGAAAGRELENYG